MTEKEKEILEYLRNVWHWMRLGIAILLGSIVALWALCWILNFIKCYI